MSWTLTEAFLIESGNGSLFLVSNSAEETFSLGQKIAVHLAEGSVIALQGELGSGKTCLTKGIASGLGITENVTSPTYTIISEYSCIAVPAGVFYHIDAYRINNDEDFEQIGGIEIINGSGISVIEWSERIKKSLPPGTITVTIKITGSVSRSIQINGLSCL